VPLRKPHRLWLKLAPRWVNVVLAIAVRPVPRVKPVATDVTASTVCPASQEIAVHQPHQRPNWCPEFPINARAKLHQETPAQQDQKDPTDHPEMEVHRAPMANQATKDHVDPPDHPDHREIQETKDQLAIPAESPEPKPVHQAQQAPTANPALQALQATLAMPAKMAAQALQVLQEMLVLQAAQAKQAVPAAQAMLAKPAHLAVANTAHQLVWPQVIKTMHKGASDWTSPPSNAKIRTLIIFILFLIVPNLMTLDKNTFHSSQTFHVLFYLCKFFKVCLLSKQYCDFGSLV